MTDFAGHVITTAHRGFDLSVTFGAFGNVYLGA